MTATIPFWQYMDKAAYQSWQAAKFKESAAREFAALIMPDEGNVNNVQLPPVDYQDFMKQQHMIANAPSNINNPMTGPQANTLNPPVPDVAPQMNNIAQQLISSGVPIPSEPPTPYPMLPVESSPLGQITGYGPGGIIKSGFRKVADALDWYNENVTKPIGGAALMAPDYLRNVAFGGQDRNEFFRQRGFSDQAISGSIFNPSTIRDTFEGLGNYSNNSNAPGIVKFGLETAGDPLNFIPSKAISAVTSPLMTTGRKLSEGISQLPVISHLFDPSVGADSAKYGEKMFHHVRDMIDSLSPSGFARATPSDIMQVRSYMPQFAKMGGTNIPFQDLIDIENALPSAARALLNQGAIGADAYATMIAKQAERMDKELLQGAIRSGRSGLGGAVLNKFDDLYNATFGKYINPLSRSMAGAFLATPMFPIGNIAESAGLSAADKVGPKFMRAADAAERLAGITDNVPAFVVSEGMDRLGPLGRAMGYSDRPDKWHDWLTGRKFLELGNKPNEAIRRNYWMSKFDDALGKGVNNTEAARQASEQLYRHFPMIQTERNIDVIGKNLFPFFGYETRRWPVIAQVIAQNPEALTGYARYKNASDDGNVPLAPGIQVNPFQGTIAGALGQLGKESFDAYSEGKTGAYEELQSALAKPGFYFSGPIGLGAALARKAEGESPQLGGVVPSTWMNVLNLPQVANLGNQLLPEQLQSGYLPKVSDMAQSIQNNVFDNRFRDYAVRQELASNGIEPNKATPEQMKHAQEIVALKQLASTETNVMKFKPQEAIDYQEQLRQAAIDAGINPEWIRKDVPALSTANPETGQRVLTAQDVAAIYERNPQWKAFQSVTVPLKPETQRIAIEQTRKLNEGYDKIQSELEAELAPLARAFETQAISGQQYRDQRKMIMTKAQAKRESLMNMLPEALSTPEKRDAFYQATGYDAPEARTEDMLLRQYRDIEPQEKVDPRTGQGIGILDMQKFQQDRQAFLSKLTPEQRNYITNSNNKYTVPEVMRVEERYKQAMDALTGWNNIPKFLGLTSDDSDAVERARGDMRALAQMNPLFPSELVRALVMRYNPRGAALSPLASRLRNPQRASYLSQYPDLVRFLSPALLQGYEEA